MKFIYSESVFNKLYIEINHKCQKNFIRTKKTVQKVSSFFFRELQLIRVLLLICDFYMGWSARFISLKLCVRFSIFVSVSLLLKFILFFNKCIDSLTLKRHNSFQNKSNRKVIHSFAPRCRFKVDKITNSKLWSRATYDVSENKPLLYP